MTGVADWALAQADVANVPVEEFDIERTLEQHRVERDLFERKIECQLRGLPFQPTAAEQEALDRLEREREARLNAEPTKEHKERWERLQLADMMEADLNSGRFPDELSRQRIRARVAELRKE
jgi:hypothetical protein